jgi:hypothetical protein
MKLIAIGLLATVCFAGGSPGSPPLAPITLFTQYLEKAPKATVEALEEEVGSILAPSGIHFEWHNLASAAEVGTAVELAVVTFRGTCDVSALPQKGITSTQALGFTSVTDGEILPFTTIECDRTRNFLSSAMLRLPANERPALFGRALGRILAHELYHIFARTQRHGHTGVAKEAYTVSDLMAEEFELEEREFDMLRASPAFNMLQQPATR